jgi:hypothetical protein
MFGFINVAKEGTHIKARIVEIRRQERLESVITGYTSPYGLSVPIRRPVYTTKVHYFYRIIAKWIDPATNKEFTYYKVSNANPRGGSIWDDFRPDPRAREVNKMIKKLQKSTKDKGKIQVDPDFIDVMIDPKHPWRYVIPE